jgi:hypothetical protein
METERSTNHIQRKFNVLAAEAQKVFDSLKQMA